MAYVEMVGQWRKIHFGVGLRCFSEHHNDISYDGNYGDAYMLNEQ